MLISPSTYHLRWNCVNSPLGFTIDWEKSVDRSHARTLPGLLRCHAPAFQRFLADLALFLLMIYAWDYYIIFFIAPMVGIWSPYNFGDLMISRFQQLLVSPLWAWVKFDETLDTLDTLDSTSDLRLQPGSTICSCLYPNWGSFRQLFNVCYVFWALHSGWWRLWFKHKLCDW